MSKTIDEKVVEMRFDNRQFEQNVGTTMSTLDKFKAKLNFNGATKGLENINTSASKVDLSGITTSVATVSQKFSAMEIIGITALTNITNSAIEAGKTLVKALTIDNVAEGWSKYNQETQSTQALMNATGKSMEEIEAILKQLRWYSDETSYGFTDMTQALATMAASGGKVENLIPLITRSSKCYSSRG